MSTLNSKARSSQPTFQSQFHRRTIAFVAMATVNLLIWDRAAAQPQPNTEPFIAAFDRYYRPQTNPVDIQREQPSPISALPLTELNCTACHDASSSKTLDLAPKGGPNIVGAGRRFSDDYLRRFLKTPHRAKPGTTMPSVMHQAPVGQQDQVIDALIAFLRVDAPPEPTWKSTAANPIAVQFWRKGDVSRGQRLYHRIGCVACHAVDESFQPTDAPVSDLQRRIEKLELDPEEIEQLGLKIPEPIRSVPHGDLHARHTQRSLTLFLMDPLKLRPDGRMPDFQLSPSDAADVAAYLLRKQRPRTESPNPAQSPELVKAGAEWFGKLGCVRCHAWKNAKLPSPEFKPSIIPQPLAQLKNAKLIDATPNCLRETDAPSSKVGSAPFYPLSLNQRIAIRTALHWLNPLDRGGTTQEASWTMAQLNCLACHPRNQQGGVGPQRYAFFETERHVDLGDEGRIPPPLDFVGWKLLPKQLEQTIAGKVAMRPHFSARMPAFPTHAKKLSGRLSAEDRKSVGPLDAAFAKHLPPRAKQQSLRDAGKELLNSGCVQCHPIWGERLPGVVGVDIANLSARVRPEWLDQFLRNPARWKSNTRMPTFFPNGKSSNPAILDGHVDQQIAAIWTYLNGPKPPVDELPAKLRQSRAHNFLITPKERPVVMRTFMEGGATHAVAVGFPERIHFAFDSERVATTYLWKGDFLNAHATWYDRFTPPTRPLGKVLPLPPQTFIGAGSDPPATFDSAQRQPDASVKFAGYRLDSQRVPTFLYEYNGVAIQERLAPYQSGLRRQISIRPAHSDEEAKPAKTEPPLWLAIAVGAKSMKNNADGSTLILTSGDTVRVNRKATLKQYRKQNVAVVSLTRGNTLEVVYQWK